MECKKYTQVDMLYWSLHLFLHYNGIRVIPGDKISRQTIGGSEIGSLLGQNPFQSRQELLIEKVLAHRGQSTFDPIIPCIWGIMFEPVAKLLTEYEFGKILYKNLSIINLEKKLRYTADGLGVVYTNSRGQLCYRNSSVEERIYPHKVIYEFKCPYRRTFKKNIPMYYQLQAQLGLRVLKTFDFVVFIEYIIRICANEDLGQSPFFNTKYHRDFDIYSFCPLAWGKFEVYASKGTTIIQQMDFGSMNTGFNRMMKLVGTGKWIVKLVLLVTGNGSKIDKLPNVEIGERVLAGIIPFKVMARRCQKIYERNYYCMNNLDNSIKNFFKDVDNALIHK